MADSALKYALQDLKDAVSDFKASSSGSGLHALTRFVHYLDEEPLSGFLAAEVPKTEFDSFWDDSPQRRSAMAGSGALAWPPDRATRVSMQIELCRALTEEKLNFLHFLHEYFYSGKNIPAHCATFATCLLDPLVRDISRLIEQRPVNPVLGQVLGTISPTGDETLDRLIVDAVAKFRDPSPKSRAMATEKLWDAWERTKSLEHGGNKKLSVESLLQASSASSEFRDLLQAEASALTKIGNDFHIRHFETNRISIDQPQHFDYLFHRMYALLHLILGQRENVSASDA